MAEIVIDGPRLTVRLSGWQKVEALHGDVTVPLTEVRAVSVLQDPLGAPRGLRVPGTDLPGVVKAGTWRSSHAGRQFVLASRGERGVRVDLSGDGSFDVLLISVPDPEATVAALRTATGL
ncbi:hypothetical protein ACIQGZ_00135 [Streptomyces sp. NPDC092296]|uniref:hypothetical protein n=1 Tax=Streptomyces sp. NPDC092296 TaxID=3366012 RepID=UPI00381DE25A